MTDIIRLLPDTVANQIAAGEVVQRPASVLKELLENAVDAGSTSVRVFIKEGGKMLIQVVDDGCGMSETDARMSFERHATSKIQTADDLWQLQTFGFRGEALASIAAVAQVEMRTRREIDDIASCIVVNGGEIERHEACAAAKGTSICVKNLFYNVPARRNFLKSNTVELRHLVEEFLRVALANPGIHFSFVNEIEEIYHLRPGNLKQRIVSIWGKKYEEGLVPVDENTDMLEIKGFLGKPELARKSRGEQYFFVNGRFIRSAYLNHAMTGAFRKLIPDDAHPFYIIFLQLPPSRIDINVHPTKTEIKFEDERSIYAILNSVTQRSLSQYHIAPSLNFDEEFSMRPVKSASAINMTQLHLGRVPGDSNFVRPKNHASSKDWEELYKVLSITQDDKKPKEEDEIDELISDNEQSVKPVMQLHQKYILTSIRSGLIIVNQQLAHERVLFEYYITALENSPAASQQLLFPEVVELHQGDFEVMKSLVDDFKCLGLVIEVFGKNAYLIQGVPVEMQGRDPQHLIEQIMEAYRENTKAGKADKREGLACAFARQAAIKSGKKLSQEEMHRLIDELFACEMPYYSPDGKPILITISAEELDKKFKS
ncbi:MAG: DNA mismatch repair endonuclease MutL [Bacteroidota bacterium]|nr:DNA mismatch repair endonuclease MutL [Bacteroidota bacterium]